MFFVSCVSHAFVSVLCCLVVTYWQRADLLALVVDVYCICVTFPSGILWHLIVSGETTTTTTILGGNNDVAHTAPTSTLRYDTARDVLARVTFIITCIYCRINLSRNTTTIIISHITYFNLVACQNDN